MGQPTFDHVNFELGGATFPIGISRDHEKVSDHEYIVVRSEPGELKHLSTRRKGHQQRLR